MRLTKSDYKKALSSNGGIGGKQWDALGFRQRKKKKGWKKALFATDFTPAQISVFIKLKNAHLPKASPKKAVSHKDHSVEKSLKVYEENEELRKKIYELENGPVCKKIFDRDGKTRWQYSKPQWIELRAKVLRRDNFTCQMCGERSLTDGLMAVHHLLYERGKYVWEVPDCYLVTLCRKCHKLEHSRSLIAPPKHFEIIAN